MTSDQQEAFKARAKQCPIVPGREPMKYDSKGVPLALKEEQDYKKKSGEAQMSSSITESVLKLHKSGGNKQFVRLFEATLKIFGFQSWRAIIFILGTSIMLLRLKKGIGFRAR